MNLVSSDATTWLATLMVAAQWLFQGYFVLLNGGYIVLNMLALLGVRQQQSSRTLDDLRRALSGMEPPVSVLVPAYNEATTIAASVRSILQLEYPEFEIIVINDGSKDETLAILCKEFELELFPEAYWRRLPVKPVRGIYRSRTQPNLKVIDKVNGGKADSLNAGINAARHPLVCGVDADSVLERNSLARVVAPFLDDPRTIATGGIVRPANGCRVLDGHMERVALPQQWLPLLQVVEYLRAFLFGRLGWSAMNAVLIISGAFGVFRKDVVVEAGGYRTDTLGEDMELVTRLHRIHSASGRDYRIAFVPDPICWTDAPESLAVLLRQRQRWQRGLGESLWMNRKLLFSRRGGAAGWLAFPFLALCEWASPLIEVTAYATLIIGMLLGVVSLPALLAFLLLALGLGILLSVLALMLEALSYPSFTRQGDLPRLIAAAVLENFGYRQLLAVARAVAMVKGFTGAHQRWGDMKRSTTWQKPA